MTRSRSRQQSKEPSTRESMRDVSEDALPSPQPVLTFTITHLPELLPETTNKISKAGLQLLKLKQSKLREAGAQNPAFAKGYSKRDTIFSQEHQLAKTSPIAEVAAATLVFAQEEAGTAVCLSSSGLLLTCSHCITESPGEYKRRKGTEEWLLFAPGRAVKAKCIAWDQRRDLALLQIYAAERSPSPTSLSAEPLEGVNFLSLHHSCKDPTRRGRTTPLHRPSRLRESPGLNRRYSDGLRRIDNQQRSLPRSIRRTGPRG